MADVAKLAGVSLGTVSHVLSNRTPVRQETRERVETAMAQLGYRPNRVAQALRRQRTHVVGMIVPDVANPFFSELLLGVESRLEPAGYAVVFGNSRESGSTQQRYVDRFLERQVDGLIVAMAGDTDPFDLQSLERRTPTVLVDRTVAGWSGDQVVGDDKRGMELAVQHLRQAGHTKVALINGDKVLSTARRR
ncbi:MAG TPA: LacI family DNA-binding transcriptional regulator, partial [Blastocatellia bacterium]|nr:LacI family DNA-binding transcriptional regulator [Blastocatellia bacterium]